MVQAGPGLGNGGSVAQHAHSPLHLGQVPPGDDGGGLVVDAHLREKGKKAVCEASVKPRNGGCFHGNRRHVGAFFMPGEVSGEQAAGFYTRTMGKKEPWSWPAWLRPKLPEGLYPRT